MLAFHPVPQPPQASSVPDVPFSLWTPGFSQPCPSGCPSTFHVGVQCNQQPHSFSSSHSTAHACPLESAWKEPGQCDPPWVPRWVKFTEKCSTSKWVCVQCYTGRVPLMWEERFTDFKLRIDHVYLEPLFHIASPEKCWDPLT